MTYGPLQSSFRDFDVLAFLSFPIREVFPPPSAASLRRRAESGKCPLPFPLPRRFRSHEEVALLFFIKPSQILLRWILDSAIVFFRRFPSSPFLDQILTCRSYPIKQFELHSPSSLGATRSFLLLGLSFSPPGS